MDLYRVRQGVGQLEKETPWERIPLRCWTVGLHKQTQAAWKASVQHEKSLTEHELGTECWT